MGNIHILDKVGDKNMCKDFVDNIFKTDVLIIGGGAGGLRSAIEAREKGLEVALLAKGGIPGGASVMAAFIAGAMGEESGTPQEHFEDTILNGAYLNNQRLVRILVEEAPKRIKELEKWGMLFARDISTHFIAVREGGHRYPRLVHSAGKGSGNRLPHVLFEQALARGVKFHFFVFVTSLIKNDDEIIGATAIDMKSGNFIFFHAKATILATGGTSKIYNRGACARLNTGDGFAMALRAGAELANMEFMQYIPLGIIHEGSADGYTLGGTPKAKEGYLLNNKGERFMKRYDPVWLEKANRARMTISVAKEIKEGRGFEKGGVLVDLSRITAEEKAHRLKYQPYFPFCLKEIYGDRVGNFLEPYEVKPTALFQNGGVRINEKSETTLPNLWAVGEIACGLHGANRLGGNAQAECLVFGKIAGEKSAERAKQIDFCKVNQDAIATERERAFDPLNRKEGLHPRKLKEKIQDIMMEDVGPLRNEKGLNNALSVLKEIQEKETLVFAESKSRRMNFEWMEALEIRNMVDIAMITTKGALFREESRESHYREDYCESFPGGDNENWGVETVMKSSDDKINIFKIPMKYNEIKPGEFEVKKVDVPYQTFRA
jgi:fumarate reductase (CoM/CoB) subunit A